MKKKICLILTIALALALTLVALATTALAEEKDITVSYMDTQETTSDTTSLDTKAYENGQQVVKAGESFTLPTTANSSYVGQEGYVLVWYTQDGHTYKAGESVSFNEDTKLFRCVAKEVNNITDLNSAMTSGSNCAILTADINSTSKISVLNQGQSVLILNGFTINVTVNNNAMGSQRSGKHIYGEGTVNITNPDGKIGQYSVFDCQSHGWNGSANKTVVGRDVTINAPNYWLAGDSDGSTNNHYPWVRVYGTINVYGLFRIGSSPQRSPFIEFYDSSNVTITGPSLYFDRSGGWDNSKKQTIYTYNNQSFDIRIYGGTFNLPAEASEVEFWTFDNEESWTVLNDNGAVTQTHNVNELTDINRDIIKIFQGSFTLADGSEPAIADFLVNDYIGSIPSGGNGLVANKDTSTYHVSYMSRPGYKLVFTTYSSSALGTLTVTDYIDGSLSGTYKYTATTTTVGTANYIDTITVYEEDGATVTDKFTLDFIGYAVAFSSAAMKADMKLQAQDTGYIAVPAGCEHDYEITTVKATCSSVGYIQYTCKLCTHTATTVTEEKGEHVYELVSSVKPSGINYGSNSFTCTECGATATYSCSLDPKSINVNVTVRTDDGEFKTVTALASELFEFSTVGGNDTYIYTITGIKSFGEYSIRNIYGIEIPVGIPFINISTENNEKYENVNYGVTELSFADGVDVQVNNIGLLRNLKKISFGASAVEFTSGAGYKSGSRLPLTTIDMSKEGADIKFGSSSFEWISTLTSVVFGENSTYYLGSSCFKGCALSELNLPASSTYTLGSNAFEQNKFVSLSFPNGKDLTFGTSCFANCSLLEKIEFGENANYVIGSSCFRKSAISKVALAKNSSYKIGYQAFIGANLTEFDASAEGLTVVLDENAFNAWVDNKVYCSYDFITGEGNSYTFGKTAFAYSTFETFTLAANSTYVINEACFNNNTALTTFDASAKGVTVSFNYRCFNDRSNLTTLKLGEGSTYTFGNEFVRNSGITSLELKENSTYTFGEGSFRSLPLTELVLADNSNYTFNYRAFIDNTTITLLDFSADNSTITIKNNAIERCNNKGAITTLLLNGKNSTYSLGNSCIKNTAITSITLGEGSTYTFGEWCFTGTGFTSIDASATGITAVFNNYAMQDITSFTTLTLGESGNFSFYYRSFRNTGIKSIKFADDSTYLFRNYVFDLTALEEADFSGDNMNVTFQDNSFRDLKSLKVLKFGTNSTYDIGKYAFHYATTDEGANDIVFSNTSTFSINQQAFKNCDFSSIVFEDNGNVTITGSDAFVDCDKATYLYIGKNFKITNYPFKGMKKLEKLVIMDGVTLSSEYTFENAGSADFNTPFTVYNHSQDMSFLRGTFNNCDGVVLYTVSSIGTRGDVFSNCQDGTDYKGFTVVMGIPHKLAQSQRDPSCTLQGGTIWVGEDCNCGLVIDEELTVNVYENKHNITDSTEYARQDVYAISAIPATGHTKGDFATIVYADGYIYKGVASYNCTACDNQEGYYEEEANPIFVNYGYSKCQYGTGMVQSYHIDNEAYKAYKAVNPSFSFGLVATGNDSGEAVKPLMVENGEVVATSDKVVLATRSVIARDYFEIKIKGVETDEYKDKTVVFCAYVFDGETVYYIDNNVYADSVVGASFNSIKD